MQKNKLFYPQIKKNKREEVGIEKILSLVSETHYTQGDEEINLLPSPAIAG